MGYQGFGLLSGGILLLWVDYMLLNIHPLGILFMFVCNA